MRLPRARKGRVARARRSARSRRTALSIMGVANEKRYCRRGENGAQAVPLWVTAGWLRSASYRTALWGRRHSACRPFHHFKHHNGWNATDAEASAQFAFGFSVHFHKTHFAAALFSHIFKDRRKATAWAAPRGPEINNDWQIVLNSLSSVAPVALMTSPSKRSWPQRRTWRHRRYGLRGCG